MLVNASLICHVEMTRLNTGFWLGVYTFLPERAKKRQKNIEYGSMLYVNIRYSLSDIQYSTAVIKTTRIKFRPLC